ncbi:hypothetical protein Dimus_031420 [Dionaea muscipula]
MTASGRSSIVILPDTTAYGQIIYRHSARHDDVRAVVYRHSARHDGVRADRLSPFCPTRRRPGRSSIAILPDTTTSGQIVYRHSARHDGVRARSSIVVRSKRRRRADRLSSFRRHDGVSANRLSPFARHDGVRADRLISILPDTMACGRIVYRHSARHYGIRADRLSLFARHDDVRTDRLSPLVELDGCGVGRLRSHRRRTATES